MYFAFIFILIINPYLYRCTNCHRKKTRMYKRFVIQKVKRERERIRYRYFAAAVLSHGLTLLLNMHVYALCIPIYGVWVLLFNLLSFKFEAYYTDINVYIYIEISICEVAKSASAANCINFQCICLSRVFFASFFFFWPSMLNNECSYMQVLKWEQFVAIYFNGGIFDMTSATFWFIFYCEMNIVYHFRD